MKKEIVLSIDGPPLSLADVEAVARHGYSIAISADCHSRVEHSRRHVEQAIADAQAARDLGQPIPRLYGVTTGFGQHKQYVIDPDEAAALQANILRSHAVGVGNDLPDDVVRAIGLLRLATFIRGRSGVRLELIERIRDMINAGVVPVVPSRGSLGASGDLCPLAHWALVLIGEGQARLEGTILPGTIALARAPLSTGFSLSYKEGLALTNGTAASTALVALAALDALNVLKHADFVTACIAEALGAPTRAYEAVVHETRPHPGQIDCADNLRRLVEGSAWMNASAEVQESYSIRCVPQVHGAVADVLHYVHTTTEREINSVNDNPLFFVEDTDPEPIDRGTVSPFRDYSAGNFHGQPIALAADCLKIAVADLGVISERRSQKILDAHHNAGLPSSLSTSPGLQTGLMIAQYTAAALVSENKTLCHPASCDSIPSSANIEDHVSMSMTAALQLNQIIEHVETVLAIEILCAYQALCFRRGILPVPAHVEPPAGLRPDADRALGPAGEILLKTLKDGGVSPVTTDRELRGDIDRIRNILRDRTLIESVEKRLDGQLYSRSWPAEAAD